MTTAPDAVRLALEALMQTAEYKSDFFDRVEAQGIAQGIAQGETRILLKIIKSRGIRLTDEQLDQVNSCTDPDQVDLWADRALNAASANDIFKD
jgi:hypothetical protein